MPFSSVLGASSVIKPGVCTSSTRPTVPYEGQLIYETDTDLVLAWNGSSWRAVSNAIATNGGILQIVSTTKTDTFTTTSTSYTDLTGLSASITPSATSSTVLVQVTINHAVSGDILGAYQLVRGTTAIGIGDAASNRTRATFGFAPGSAIGMYTQAHFAFLDSPATTSATTYKMQLKTNAGTLYVNRSSNDLDTSVYTRAISTITLFEVSA